MMSTIHLLDHPLIQHQLGLIRDVTTGTSEFRRLLAEVSRLMAYEVARDTTLEDRVVQTPVAPCTVKSMSGGQVVLVPVLRAGLGMVDGFLQLLPTARVGHIGLYRDPDTLLPVEYYHKLPPGIPESRVMVLDPMLATGGSAAAVVRFLKEQGGRYLQLVCLIAAPEGIGRFQGEHPDVDVYTAAVDERLNDHGYIVPGLGDAGDRLFGT